ncbi:hypothetical protein RUM44_010550 [Polyplax serrata]|uniref:Uncharacterized protein n=1 Tax=Polyplax serrata TaxID=468196 RepID=A0ABR1AW63_POLSC
MQQNENKISREGSSFVSQGSRTWYILKILELALTVLCVVLLVLNLFLLPVDDDFSDPNQFNSTISLSSYKTEKACGEFSKSGVYQKYGSISVSDYLILFPCSFALVIIVILEIIGYIFRDPLSKVSTLIYMIISQGLSICLFTKTIHTTTENTFFTVICLPIVSGFLVIAFLINITLVAFCK